MSSRSWRGLLGLPHFLSIRSLNYPISPESPIEFQNSHYPDDKDAGAQIASDVFTTFHADTPDEERFFQETCVPVLKIEGKYSRLRAKAAHFPDLAHTW